MFINTETSLIIDNVINEAKRIHLTISLGRDHHLAYSHLYNLDKIIDTIEESKIILNQDYWSFIFTIQRAEEFALQIQNIEKRTKQLQ